MNQEATEALMRMEKRDARRHKAEIAAGVTGLVFLSPFLIIIGLIVWAALT